MRRAILSLTTMSVAVFIASGVALATTSFECGTETCRGTPGDDLMIGTPADEGRHGLAGDDLMRGLASNDHLSGSIGADAVHGDWGDDSLEGNMGDDLVTGGWGDDSLEGNGGDDIVWGGPGNDLLFGGDGDDRVDGQDRAPGRLDSDVLDCGAGRDKYAADFDDVVLANCEERFVVQSFGGRRTYGVRR